MKIWSKVNWLEYKSSPCPSDWLGRILCECFENYELSLRDTILVSVLGYKMSLECSGDIGNADYQACSEILGREFKTLSYKEIAELFGYTIIKNPRYGLLRTTLRSFEHDIARGCLGSDVMYTGEYFSIVYYLARRDLIFQSVLYGNDGDQGAIDYVKIIASRLKVFTQFYGPLLELPSFMERFKNPSWKPGIYEFCFSKGTTYPYWLNTWEEYTGKNYFEWTGEDQKFWMPSKPSADQVITAQLELINTLGDSEIEYVEDLIFYSLCGSLHEYTYGELTGPEKDKEVQIFIERLKVLNPYVDLKFLDIIDSLEALGGSWTVEDIEQIVGYKIYP